MSPRVGLQRHICNPAQGFHLFSRAIKAVLSVSQRERFLVHNDKGKGMLESLSKHRLPKHCVPVSLGGTLIVSGDTFVKDRLTTVCLGSTHHLTLGQLFHLKKWRVCAI